MKRKDFIRKMEQLLVNRRHALRRVLAGDVNALKSLNQLAGGDAVDASIFSEQAEIESQLAEVESRELARIDVALDRIRSGRYGRCETCGQPIKMVRLQAVPYATECVRCARAAERRSERFVNSRHWGRLEVEEEGTEISLDEAEAEIEAR
jgi:DnaK suppressor protein